MPESRSTMRSEHYVEQAVVQLLALKLRAGTSATQLQKFANKCVDRANRTTRQTYVYRGLDIHRLGSVLRSWHKETEYLTHDGLPRPLKCAGRSGLKSLVRRFYPAESFEAVFERLVETKLIRRIGTHEWVPTGRTARITQLSHETLEHLAEGVARYVETVTRNVTAKREQDVLFERSCKVTRLPASEFDAFREYVGQQAISFLTAVDDWLESRNSTTKRSKIALRTAGVYTFAYIVGKSMRSR
jgi:hypothetical protein